MLLLLLLPATSGWHYETDSEAVRELLDPRHWRTVG